MIFTFAIAIINVFGEPYTAARTKRHGKFLAFQDKFSEEKKDGYIVSGSEKGSWEDNKKHGSYVSGKHSKGGHIKEYDGVSSGHDYVKGATAHLGHIGVHKRK